MRQFPQARAPPPARREKDGPSTGQSGEIVSQTYEGGCFKDGEECRHGPPDTIVYICERDDQSAAEHIAACTDYATTRAWRVAQTIRDQDPRVPPAERTGWGQALAALGRDAEVIVTWHPDHVAVDLREFQEMQADCRRQAGVLVAATGTPDPRRAGQTTHSGHA